MNAVDSALHRHCAQSRRGAAVEIVAISRSYGDGAREMVALRDVTLTIPASSFVSILGPSGCGKSTLLNIVAGFERPTAGSVQVDGQPISGPSSARGVVFQDSAALFPWLTVAGNVAFGLRAAGHSRNEIRERVDTVLDLVKLSAFADRRPHELSGGMRQLVAISRVLVMEPRILLMDEPFAALDALTRQRMQERLMHIWRLSPVTVLFVTHSVDEAIFLSDEVAVMSPRPGMVRKRLTVDIKRPRSSTSLRFNELKQVALTHLSQQVEDEF